MKKTLLALAALTAFAGVASAQSSVTLFGIVDLAARSVSNGNAGSLKTLSSDGSYSSRLGFRGVEDIGGGLRAGFWLEAGLGADTGSVGVASGAATSSGVGAFFNRRATVSLIGGFGEIRLGRDYVPTFWNHTVFDPFGTQGVGSANNLINPGGTGSGSNTTRVLGVPSGASGDSRTGSFVRADNSVGYFLPALGGLYGQVMVAAGENSVGNKYGGGRIGYAAGPINVAAAYGKTTLVNDSIKEYNIAGSFNAGFATFYGQYSNIKVGDAELANVLAVGAGSSYGKPGGRNLKNFMGGITVPVGAGTIKATFAKTKGDLNTTNAATTVAPANATVAQALAAAGAPTARDASATQFALGYVYDLSKRTSLYTHVSQIKNKGGARFYASGSGLPYTSGSLNASGITNDFTSKGYEFGIRHSF